MPNFFEDPPTARSRTPLGTRTQRECPRPAGAAQGLPDAPAALSAGCGRFPAARACRRGTTFSLPLPPCTPALPLTVLCLLVSCFASRPLSLSLSLSLHASLTRTVSVPGADPPAIAAMPTYLAALLCGASEHSRTGPMKKGKH